MAARRAVVVLIVLLTGVCLGTLLVQVLAPGGWTAPKVVMFAAFLGTAPWTGLCLANGLIGFVVLMVCRDPVRSVFPVAAGDGDLPPIAIAVTVRNEDMRRVLSPLRRLLLGLDQAGAGSACTVFILSDTLDADAAAVEQQAVAAFRAEDRDPTRIRYRRRAANTGFKAGNIMDFLDHHAEGFELMVTLDADSEMSAAAVLRLVRAMQADPTLGIAQHLTVGLPARSAFPRLFQFGMRAGMRTWATGQAWWQGDEGPYWGHNAVVRIAPFRAHCRLPALPGGRYILSHDQVEAAALRGAGWGVRVLPDEDGSWEANPPALPEFLRRELRWLAGNQQYRHLLRLPGLRPIGRWQLLQAILMFCRRAVLPAVPARRRLRRGDGRHIAVSRRARARAHRCLARRAVCAEAAGLRRGGIVAGPAGPLRRIGTLRRQVPRRRSASACCWMPSRRWRRPAPCCSPGVGDAGRVDAAEPQRTRRDLGRGGQTALAADRSRRAGVRRLLDRWMDGDAVGAAACRWPAGGDPALCADRRSARRPLAARATDRGDPGRASGSHARSCGGRAGIAATGRTGLRRRLCLFFGIGIFLVGAIVAIGHMLFVRACDCPAFGVLERCERQRHASMASRARCIGLDGCGIPSLIALSFGKIKPRNMVVMTSRAMPHFRLYAHRYCKFVAFADTRTIHEPIRHFMDKSRIRHVHSATTFNTRKLWKHSKAQVRLVNHLQF